MNKMSPLLSFPCPFFLYLFLFLSLSSSFCLPSLPTALSKPLVFLLTSMIFEVVLPLERAMLPNQMSFATPYPVAPSSSSTEGTA